jgi:hypothetical protein
VVARHADLIRGALRMNRGPRLPRALRIAVRLTYAGAAVELACAHASGQHAARVAFRVVHVIITLGVIAEADPGIGAYGMTAAIAAAVTIQVQLAAVALLFYPGMTPLPYRSHRQLDPAQR